MEQYICQLLEDLLAAHRRKEDEKPEFFLNEEEKQEKGIEAFFEEIDRYVSGDHDQLVKDVIGMIPEQFPPVGQLDASQQSRVSAAYQDLLWSWNIATDLPDALPEAKKYELLMTTLDKRVFIGESGINHLEFCQYDVESCPLGSEYCTCKDFDQINDEDDMDNFEPSDGELPF